MYWMWSNCSKFRRIEVPPVLGRWRKNTRPPDENDGKALDGQVEDEDEDDFVDVWPSDELLSSTFSSFPKTALWKITKNKRNRDRRCIDSLFALPLKRLLSSLHLSPRLIFVSWSIYSSSSTCCLRRGSHEHACVRPMHSMDFRFRILQRTIEGIFPLVSWPRHVIISWHHPPTLLFDTSK